MTDRKRVFDHLDGTPEDKHLSRAAWEMRLSAWWERVPTYEAPDPVAGEIVKGPR